MAALNLKGQRVFARLATVSGRRFLAAESSRKEAAAEADGRKPVFDAHWRKVEEADPAAPRAGSRLKLYAGAAAASAFAAGSCYLYIEYIRKPRELMEAQRLLDEAAFHAREKADREAVAREAAKQAAEREAARREGEAKAARIATEEAAEKAERDRLAAEEAAENARLAAEQLEVDRLEARREISEALAARDAVRTAKAMLMLQRAALDPLEEAAVARSNLEAAAMKDEPVDNMAKHVEFAADIPAHDLQSRIKTMTADLAAEWSGSPEDFKRRLSDRLFALEESSLRELHDELVKADEHREEIHSEQLREQSDKCQEQLEEVVAGEAAKATVVADAELASDDADILHVCADMMMDELGSGLDRIALLSLEMASIQKAMSGEEALVRRLHRHNAFSSAVSKLERTLLNGRYANADLKALRGEASSADVFSALLLSMLPPSVEEYCCHPCSPTEAVLRQRLAGETKGLAATAFAPGSGLLSELIGQTFAWLYILDADAHPPHASPEAARNLAVLNRAAQAPDVRSAVLELETGLTGSCKEQASPILAETRAALELRQVLAAVSARVRCEHSTLG